MAAAPTAATVIDLGAEFLPGFNDAHAYWPDGTDEAALAAIQEALAGGWTSISAMFVDERSLDRLRWLDETSQLMVRVNAYLLVNADRTKLGIWFGDHEPRQTFSPHLRIGK